MKEWIPLPKKVHKMTKKIGDIGEFLKYFPEGEGFSRRNRAGDPKTKKQETKEGLLPRKEK